jgi:hypothetical protein
MAWVFTEILRFLAGENFRDYFTNDYTHTTTEYRERAANGAANQ